MKHFVQRLNEFSGPEDASSLVIFWTTNLFVYDTLFDIIEANTRNVLVPSNVVLIVRSTIFNETKAAIGRDDTIVSRLDASTPFLLIGYGANGEMQEQENLSNEPYNGTFDIKRFRRQGIAKIAKDRKLVVQSSNHYHFENPSGRHSTQFLRLANILTEASEIVFIAFCCLGYFRENTETIYIDTPALYSLVFSIEEQIRSFTPNTNLEVINFESYFNLQDYDFKYSDESLVLISASSTGGLAQTLITQKEFEPWQVVQILYLGNGKSTHTAVCNLALDAENPDGFSEIITVRADECVPCKRYSVPIPIQSDQFTFAGPQLAPITILERHQHPELKEFLKCALGTEALQVGLSDDISRLGDHQHFISLDVLLNSDKFLEKVNFVLDRSFPARATKIVCATADSKLLARHIARRMKLDEDTCLISIEQIASNFENNDCPIVVVADAVESGRSLQDISRRLRDFSQKVPIVYFVGISKTSGEPGRQNLRNTLVFREGATSHNFESMFTLCLPPSTGSHAWIEERNFLATSLSGISMDGETFAFFEQRKAAINASSPPLKTKLFIPTNVDGALTLKRGFAFWKNLRHLGDSEADVFFTVSSVLQSARAIGSASSPSNIPMIRSNWLQQTVIDPVNFDRYNDGMIQAAFLRSAHPKELNYASSALLSHQAFEIIRSAIESSKTEHGTAAAEFLLAIATSRLNLCEAQKVRLRQIDSQGLSGIVKALLQCC